MDRRHIEQLSRELRGGRPAEIGRRRGSVLMRRAARNVRFARAGRRVRIGQSTGVPLPEDDGDWLVAQEPGGGGGGTPGGYGVDAYCSPVECETYGAPPVIVGPDGCDIGYNGCGDTIGVSVAVAATSTVDIAIPAAIEFTPRYFVYSGPAATFLITRIFVANGPNSNFGVGYSADVYALNSFTSKRVSWPTFYNSPPLSITVQNLSLGQQTFAGLLIGVASHQ